jgi:CBS domain-containing protein
VIGEGADGRNERVEDDGPVNRATDELCAGDVMTRKFLCVKPESTLGEVAELMGEEGTGSALVLELGRLCGIVTSRDVLRAVAERARPSEALVRDWMTPAPVTGSREMPTDEAARTMLAGGFHHLPVVEDDRPVGVVGLRSALGALQHGLGW